MGLLDDMDVARMREDSEDLVAASGTTRLLLRQPMQPARKVGDEPLLDPDFHTPTRSAASLPWRERTIVAKIRSTKLRELQAAGIGELQLGDLIASVDPKYYDDPLQPIAPLDEIRFEQMTTVPQIGVVSSDWDYVVHAVLPVWGKDVCVELSLILRRKQIKTEGGSRIDPSS